MSVPRIPISLQIPNRDKIIDKEGLASRTWLDFFRYLKTLLDPMGYERAVPLLNDQASAVNIEGLAFNKTQVTGAVVEIMVRRVGTVSENSVVSAGIWWALYNPFTDLWSLKTVSTFDTGAGVSLSITASGQIQYTTTNIGGASVVSDLVYRARTFAGKNSLFSTGA